jgi:organic radical activating enzyme
MRRDNLAGQPLDPKSCSYCINDEKIGKQSRRTGEIIRRGNVASPSVGPKYIEITMEYTCNNACMICSQARSSLWKKYTDVDQREDLTHAVDQDVYQLLENLDLSQLDHITIMGGEPLLTDRHVTLLRTLERRGVDLGKIELWYNTNGTCRVDDEVLRLWSRLKQVILKFSLDDTGEAFNYQRFPADWNTVSKNMYWFRDNLSPNVLMRVERTVSLLNAHRLTFVDQWVRDDFPFNGFDQAVEVQTHVAFGVMGLGHISAPHLEFLKSMPESYALLNRMYPMSDIQQTDQDNGRVLSHVDTQDQRRDVAIGSYFPEFRSFYL